ncbi:hypothetical protein KUM42_03320 [Modestobacter sp. L9-4]|uniref:hypothetical protein n=1 Tax=Modestobacter sp. L9-4 TaxID=2851567 RepID=UPI001C7524BE|nr:hypothetical protein [Modestobacter sp. L9-4]QXG76598.1 hypothetical protein KUM42_03320 [Modestobacter sp. L9-4]
MLTQRTPEGRRLADRPAWLLCSVLGVVLGLAGAWPAMWVVLAVEAVAAEAGWGTVDPALVDDGLGTLIGFTVGLGLVWSAVAAPVGVIGQCCAALPARRWWTVLGGVSLGVAVLGGLILYWPR